MNADIALHILDCITADISGRIIVETSSPEIAQPVRMQLHVSFVARIGAPQRQNNGRLANGAFRFSMTDPYFDHRRRQTSTEGRNTQHLARINLVRMVQHRPVSLKNHRIFAAFAIARLGNL